MSSSASPSSGKPSDAAETPTQPASSVEGANAARREAPQTKGRKPFPWPIFLAVASPLASAGLLAWFWMQEDLYLLGRTGWICLSVVLPGLSLMTILGSVAQFRRRPIFSSLALFLALATFLACVWGVRLVTEATWLD